MRLTIKLVGMLFIVMLIIIAIDGYLSMVREVGLFRENMRSNALMLGNVSKGMITEVWQSQGRERALELIGEISQAEHRIRLSYVDSGDLESLDRFFNGRKTKLDSLKRGWEVSVDAPDAHGAESLFTFIPLNMDTEPGPGVILLAESFDNLKSYTRETLIRVFILSAVLMLAGMAMIWILGRRYVGKPLQHLMARTRKIGAGDFSREEPLPGHNELTHLSVDINDMCASLEEALNSLQNETEEKIAAIEQLRHTERLATVGRLASGVAHELGTPLNVIAGRAKIMSSETDDINAVNESCTIISEQANRMTKIIKQLLDFARRRRSQRKASDIRPLVSEIADILSPMARKTGVSIEVDIPEGLPPANIDQSQIQQVLINIVVNGIQAMPEGGQLRITSQAVSKVKPTDEIKSERKFVCIRVQDQGQGIPAEIVDKIFDPFFTTKDVGAGTGLGLSISHGIVEEHEGWIDVQSDIGKGTEFSVFLPAGENNG